MAPLSVHCFDLTKKREGSETERERERSKSKSGAEKMNVKSVRWQRNVYKNRAQLLGKLKRKTKTKTKKTSFET